MNQYEEAAKAYVQALHLTPSAKYDLTPLAFDLHYHPSIYPLTPSCRSTLPLPPLDTSGATSEWCSLAWTA
jgi:hypothetical protein